MTIVPAVFANAAGCLRARVDAESQTYVELVVMMLSTMRDIYQVVVRSFSASNALTCAWSRLGKRQNMANFVRECFVCCRAIPSWSHTRGCQMRLGGGGGNGTLCRVCIVSFCIMGLGFCLR
jgi:hypothetical protein